MPNTKSVPVVELQDLVEDWSDEADQAHDEGDVEFAIALSVASDNLREVIEDAA